MDLKSSVERFEYVALRTGCIVSEIKNDNRKNE